MNRKNRLVSVLFVLVVVQIGLYTLEKGLLGGTNNGISASVSSVGFYGAENTWISGIFDNFTEKPDINNGVLDIANNTDNVIEDVNGSSSEMNKTNNSCGYTQAGEKLYVMSGYNGNSTLNDVWSTIDGVNWINEKQYSPYTKRTASKVLYVNKIFYLFGGTDSGIPSIDTDTYISNDAKDWKFYGKLPSYGNRVDSFNIAFFNNKFWLLGLNPTSNHFTLWNSADGKQWVQNSNVPSWVANLTSNNNFYVFKSKLFLLGMDPGSSGVPGEMTIWSTNDGTNWNYESSPRILTENIPGARQWANPFVYNNKVWIVSGINNNLTGTKYYDVYSSSDGKTWNQVTNTAPFDERWFAVNIGFINKLWTIGGRSNNRITYFLSDEWNSNDGLSWTKELFINKPTILLNRSSATGVVVPYYTSTHAPDLHIVSDNGTVGMNSKVQNNVPVGKWTFSGDSLNGDATYSGKISLNSLLVVGTQMTNGSSSLQYMKNIRVFVDGILYATIPSFAAPYYDTLHYGGVPQTIPFKTGVTLDLAQGQSKTVKLVADVSNAPENFTTYIIGVGHVWDNGTGNGTPDGNPCHIYGNNGTVPFGGYPGGDVAIFLSVGTPIDKGKSTPLSN